MTTLGRMPTEWFCVAKCSGKEVCKHRLKADGKYEAHHRWKGEGDPPSRWNAGGTIVYRTFSDFCD
jgi:hypothetical protein